MKKKTMTTASGVEEFLKAPELSQEKTSNELKIGIIGWNSPQHSESQTPFLESLTKQITQVGGSPNFYGISGGWDSFSGNHELNGYHLTQHYELPSRDLVADQIELLIHEENLKGLVMVPWSISALVGQLMGTARCGIPTIFLPYYRSWPQLNGSLSYRQSSLLLLLEVFGLTKIGTLEKNLSPESEKDESQKIQKIEEFTEWGSQRIVEFVKQKVSPKRYFSSAAFQNCMVLDSALGGSEETYLHLAAIAREVGLEFSWSTIQQINKKSSQLVPMDKTGEFRLHEFEKLGGLVALLSACSQSLQSSPTVVGKSILEIAKGTAALRSSFKSHHPYKSYGGMCVLFGPLARDGALFRIGGLKESWLKYSGVVKVFNSQQDCVTALDHHKIKKGEILVIRYCGPRGSVGMPLLSGVMEGLEKQGLKDSVAILTDGRIQNEGVTPSIVQISPEAAVGGPLAILEDGDQVSWDCFQGILQLRLTDTELRVRLSRWKEQPQNLKNSYLSRYLKYASSTVHGATLA